MTGPCSLPTPNPLHCLALLSQLAAVVENTAALKELQETPDPPEALGCIPALQVGKGRAWANERCGCE